MVTLFNVGREGCQVIKAKVHEAWENPRYQLKGYYNESEGRYIPLGGAWNADTSRMFTVQDVREVRRELKKIGVVASEAEVDAMLHHGESVLTKRKIRDRANAISAAAR